MKSPTVLHALPLFPLGSVLFPDGLLPLRIFEVRYLDMIGKCHKAGAPFGVVSLTEGSEVRKAGSGAETFSAIGTLATIVTLASPQPGLLQIECRGTERFHIRSSVLLKHGLWTAEAETMADDVSVTVPDDLTHTAVALKRLLGALEERLAQAPDADESALPIGKPFRFDDCGWVANRWCEFLPVPNEVKQRLMTLDSPLMRLELVSDLLARTGIAE